MKIKLKQQSFVSLMAVIIAGAVGVSASVALLLLGTDRLRSSQSVTDSRQAAVAADACAEIALHSLKLDINYSGGEDRILEKGECEILPVINSGGQNPTIRTRGSSAGAVKRLEIKVGQVAPQIIIESWQEKESF